MYTIHGSFRVENSHVGSFLEQVLADLNCWRFSGIVSVLLEGSPKHTDLLIFDIRVKSLKDSFKEGFLAILVD